MFEGCELARIELDAAPLRVGRVGHTVVCPDLRAFGEVSEPADSADPAGPRDGDA
jgi:hypothetical protein